MNASREPLRSVLLYYPEYDSTVTRSNLLEVPLPVLHVARALLREGFDVRILDGRVPGANESLKSLEAPPLFFGVSCFLGQLGDGTRAAEIVRSRFPGIPLVCGGWLPTLLPEALMDSGPFTIMVRGPAEEVAGPLALCLAREEAPFHLPGVFSCREGPPAKGARAFAPSRPPSLDLPYHLLDLDRYELSRGRVDFLSSRGCPSLCTFCGMASVYKGGWFARGGEEIAEALDRIHARFKLERVQFYDDSFFTDPDRVRRMASALLERELDLLWMATGRPEDLALFRGEDWDLAARSGCALVSCGIESASPRILRLMGKRHGREEVLATAARLHEAGIRFAPFLILGAPEETEEELEATLSLAAEVLREIPECRYYMSVFMYFPMPNTPLFRMEQRKGLLDHFPSTVEAIRLIAAESHWGQAPWIPRPPPVRNYRDRRRTRIRSFYFWVQHLCPWMVRPQRIPLAETIRRSLQGIVDRRVRTGYFRLPIEWHLYRAGWTLKRWWNRSTASVAWRRSGQGLIPQGTPRP